MAEKETKRLVATSPVQERLDVWLTGHTDLSRSQVKQFIDEGLVLVNGTTVKAGYKLKAGDQVDISIPEPQEVDVLADNIPLDIVYEDDVLAVINKPKGLTVHPAAGNWNGTLVNALLHRFQHLSRLGGPLRPGIVHRLDKDTSGLMLVAKTDDAHLFLAEQLKEHHIQRWYLALVHGNLKHDTGTIEAPIGRHPKDRKRMAVVDGGREAVTHFTVQERFLRHTLVECRLETGRTHQIRVHFSAIHHPIVGDPVYGSRGEQLGATSQMLHAYYLGFTHPDGRWLEFQINPPVEFQEVLEKARRMA